MIAIEYLLGNRIVVQKQGAKSDEGRGKEGVIHLDCATPLSFEIAHARGAGRL